jgi:hypothetical protein
MGQEDAMAKEGGQADVLRALGRFLDEQGATQVEINNHEMFLAVSWAEAGAQAGPRAYQEKDLEGLREQARAMRKGFAGGTPTGTLGELLRTLGQELDNDDVEVAGILQEDDGFRVSGSMGGRYYNRLFMTSELLSSSGERMMQRAPARPEPTQWQDPMPHVSVGLPVHTRDGQRVGRVGAIQGRSIKVETPMLQRDFWLSAELIANADVRGGVVLTVPKSELNQHKNRVPVV